MQNSRFHTRSILIATRDGNRLFSSPSEVPPHLRRPLEEALHNEWTTTIIIADQNGRDEALKRIQVLQSPPHPPFPYARHAALAGLGAFLLWALATLR